MRPTPTAVAQSLSLAFRLKPIRSIQSYVEISLFPLDESGSPSAVNNTFLSYRIRDKNPQEQGAQ
jgi:hypothetical protein